MARLWLIGLLRKINVDKIKTSRKKTGFPCVFLLYFGLFLLSPLLFAGPESQTQRQEGLGQSARPGKVEAVGPIGITVSNLNKVLPFYTRVLKFKKLWISEVYGTPWEKLYGIFGARIRTARLKLGKEVIELNEYLTPQGRPIPLDSRSNDLWFQHIAIVVSDMEKAYRHLRRHGARYVSTGPQRIPDWNKNAAGIKAFYFKDPDGHVLEIIYFPPGKGAPRWQKDKSKLFLGIDHTAIGVGSTQRSLGFYRNLLSLRVVGKSLNYGIEQARLNNIENAKVKISTLKALDGPGIEFLHYLKPGPGRPYPRDSKANDLWHWQSTLYVRPISFFWKKLKAKGARLLSPGVIQLNKSKRRYRKAFLARDPDGHGLLFAEMP